MNEYTVPDLKELIRQASEIAEEVPENLREAAFNRALDFLTESAASNVIPSNNSGKSQKPSSKKKTSAQTEIGKESQNVDHLLAHIDSTKHPGVSAAGKILDQALLILQIALNEHQIDGLTPADIAQILKEKFRVTAKAGPISVALGRAANLTDRIPFDKGYKYRIMSPGEQHLAHTLNGEPQQANNSKKRRPVPKKKTSPSKNTDKSTGKKSVVAATKKKSSGKSMGPKTALTDLLNTGYFSENRSAPEIQSHLKSYRGYNFDIDSLRMAMLRLIRDQKLMRSQNSEGNYEYRSSTN
jgi:hypothetical protein